MPNGGGAPRPSACEASAGAVVPRYTMTPSICIVVKVAAVTSNATYATAVSAAGVHATVRRAIAAVRAAGVSEAMSPLTPSRSRVFVVDPPTPAA